jgi:aspartyl-tRNA(Asn)/glutamyl-tRNA(Gln) amidotransferase subunit A
MAVKAASTVAKTTSSIREITDAIKKGERSALEVTEEFIAHIESTESTVNSFLYTDFEGARAAAKAVDAAKADGATLGPLAGVPLALKDNIVAKGSPTTCGSNILDGYQNYDATATSLVKTAGAVVLGKTNMDEFGMGSTTETSAYQITTNPSDPTRVPGGSSGGSAAAVAASECVAALGTDTGGSIRQPASFCGIVGLKPTYGRVSRYGLVAYSSSLDVIGPMARSVEDVAHVLQAIAGLKPTEQPTPQDTLATSGYTTLLVTFGHATLLVTKTEARNERLVACTGHDARDATSALAPVDDYTSGLLHLDHLASKPLAGKRFGVVVETMGQGVETSVRESIHAACKHYESLGAEIVEISLPTFKYGLPAYYVIAPSEASSNLSRYDGVRYGKRSDAGELAQMYKSTRQVGFGSEVKKRILLGTYTLSAGYYDAYYKKAQQVCVIRNGPFY